MKRKYSFKSYMNNELVSHIQNYGELTIKNKVVEINIDTYTFLIEKDKVIVTYIKPYENKFEFDRNRVTQTMYQTQFGEIAFEVYTKVLEFDGGILNLEYSLYQGEEKQADYRIILKTL